MKMQGIYKIINRINNKIYIGQSIDINLRFKQHKNNAIIKKILHPLYNSIRCYGIDNFEFIILEEVLFIAELDKKEQYWMDFYNSYNSEFGYNICKEATSTKGYKHTIESRYKMIGKLKSKEFKEKMSISKKGKKMKPRSDEHRKNLSLSSLGHTVSKKTRDTISLSLMGFKHTNETRNKMAKSKKGKVASDESRKKMSNAKKGKKFTEEHILNLKEAHKNLYTTEFRQKLSDSAKKAWEKRKLKLVA